MYQAVAYFNYANFEADPVTAIRKSSTNGATMGKLLGVNLA